MFFVPLLNVLCYAYLEYTRVSGRFLWLKRGARVIFGIVYITVCLLYLFCSLFSSAMPRLPSSDILLQKGVQFKEAT